MTLYQEEMLIKEFKANHYVSEERKHQLARSLNVSATRVAAWYCNRRFRKKHGLLATGVYTCVAKSNCAVSFIYILYTLHIHNINYFSHSAQIKHTQGGTHTHQTLTTHKYARNMSVWTCTYVQLGI